jgi:glycerate 2-kinase
MSVLELRASARSIWEAALDAASPATSLHNALQLSGSSLKISGKTFELNGRLIVVAAGKAAARMSQVAEEILDARLTGGIAVTKYGHRLPLGRIRLVEAGHPIPDAEGVRAVHEMRELLRGLRPEDLVLCLISGGGSALWPDPAEGITLEEKQQVTSLLLRAGANIRELNAVRKHLSEIKGGQLARWVSPARLVSLIMSDVIGDPLDFIASGPTAPDTTSFADALGVVRKYDVEIPQAALKRLEEGAHGRIPDTPKPGDPVFERVENVVIANNRLLVDAASRRARELGFNTLTLATEIEGEAKEVGGLFAAIARESPIHTPACILAAGETTVTVRGDGKGGRNQEMALAWAMAMANRPMVGPCCFASVATDGTDGPTDAAGGLVDPDTCRRGGELGLNAAHFLQTNNSYNFLKGVGDLILTGPTHTNLMDLQILLLG